MSILELLSPDDRDQTFCGITVGVVTDIRDPDRKDRVKVRLLNRSDSVQETDFIRVMTPAAGKEFGFFDLPEVGDEVLVGFADGDLTDPYVLGSLWNTKAPPPVKNEIRVLKAKKAHRLEFNDGEETPGLTLQTAGGHGLVIDDGAKLAALSDKDGANSLKIDINGGSVTLEAKTRLTLKCGGASRSSIWRPAVRPT